MSVTGGSASGGDEGIEQQERQGSLTSKVASFGSKLRDDVKTLLHYPSSSSETDGSDVTVHQLNNVKEMIAKCQDTKFEANSVNPEGYTQLHLLVKRKFEAGKEKMKEELMVALLTYSRAKVDLPNNDGNTPLHSAVQMWDLKAVKCLSVFDADMNALNLQNETPLDLLESSSVAPLQGSTSKESTDLEEDKATSPLPAQTPSSQLKESGKALVSSSAENNSQEVAAFLKICGAKRGKEVIDKVAGNSLLQDADVDDGLGKSQYNIGQESDLLARAFSDIRNTLDQKLYEAGLSEKEGPGTAKYLGMLSHELHRLQKGGSRVLCMDGGGIRGLIQMELLSQLEQLTGKKVTELFDWIIGTSTGGIVALGLVYPKKTLHELRQFYFKTREEVFGKGVHGMAYDTNALIKILKTEFGGYLLTDVKHPKVLVAAVDKSTVNLKLHFFNNCFDDEFSTQEVWKVARYTCAGPTMFKELDDYVDGGVMAQNPSTVGITKIQEFYWQKKLILPISLVVSIGTGILPEDKLGCTDAQDFLSFGKQWFTSEESVGERTGNLVTLLGNAIVESETANRTCKTLCALHRIPFFRYNPTFTKAVSTGETDLDTLMDMLINTKTNVSCESELSGLVRDLQEKSEVNAQVLKQIRSGDMPGLRE